MDPTKVEMVRERVRQMLAPLEGNNFCLEEAAKAIAQMRPDEGPSAQMMAIAEANVALPPAPAPAISPQRSPKGTPNGSPRQNGSGPRGAGEAPGSGRTDDDM